MRATVKRLEHTIEGNGKPSLFERMKTYVDGKHLENKASIDKLSDKQDSLMRLVYIGFGIVIALESVGIFKR